MRDEVWRTVKYHGVFQEYHFVHHLGRDRNGRDRYKNHPHYQACLDFCEKWDQASFDPDYDTEQIEHFEPLVRRMFAREPFGACERMSKPDLISGVRPGIQALPEPAIREVVRYGFRKEGLISLWFGESDTITPQFIRDAAAKALSEGDTRYTPNRGTDELRSALAEYWRNISHASMAPGWVPRISPSPCRPAMR